MRDRVRQHKVPRRVAPQPLQDDGFQIRQPVQDLLLHLLLRFSHHPFNLRKQLLLNLRWKSCRCQRSETLSRG
ncbi:hypothetical protein EV2_002017 [Malus domestica]